MNTTVDIDFNIINAPDTIIFGIGNVGRGDDGLGWAFLDAIKASEQFKGKIEYRYQLQIEDAERIRNAGQVIFVDAHQGYLDGGFDWSTVMPSTEFAFTSHVLPPSAILFLCEDLYLESPPSFVLGISGEKWGLDIGMSDYAKNNLANSLDSFFHLLRDKNQ